MDVSLEQLRCECSPTEYKDALKLLFVYIKNVHENPSVEKYRKIRTGNERFNKNVWRHQMCRTILLLTGFEEDGDHIVLMNNADVSLLYKLLEEQTSSKGVSATTQKDPPSLNLAATAGQGGFFSADLKADLTLLSYMMEMGYTQHAAEKGLIATKNQGVQPAMDWIETHPECHVMEKKQNIMDGPSSSSSSSSSSKPQVSSPPSSSITPITSRLHNANEQKHAFQEKLRLEAIKKAKLEKAEDKMAKKYLMKNMQSERVENKEKFEREKIIRHVETDHQEKLNMNTSTSIDENMCVLRIKMHDGKTVTWETGIDTSIKDLFSHVTELMNDSIEEYLVSIPHPHEVLDPEDGTSLKDKGLYPKSTVVVQKRKQENIEDTAPSGDNDTLMTPVEDDEGDNRGSSPNSSLVVSPNIPMPDVLSGTADETIGD